MKSLALLASLFVAAAASAVDLKSPDDVAREWNQAVGTSSASVVPDSLLATGPLTTMNIQSLESSPRVPTTPAQSVRSGLHRKQIINGEVLIAGDAALRDSKMVHIAPGETPPPGAKRWEYRGQEFWLIPIAAPTVVAQESK